MDIYADFDTSSFVSEQMNQIIQMYQRYLTTIGSIVFMENMKKILPRMHLNHQTRGLSLPTISTEVSCMIYYLERSLPVYVHSTTRLLLTSISSNNLHLKQLPAVQSSYLNKCCENIINHRAYLRYLGKPVGEMDYVWGDNESMINSSTVPEAKLH